VTTGVAHVVVAPQDRHATIGLEIGTDRLLPSLVLAKRPEGSFRARPIHAKFLAVRCLYRLPVATSYALRALDVALET